MRSAQEALEELQEGNKRFLSGKRKELPSYQHREELAHGQHPFAIILGCSDSRVPPELIFDQGLGDLFVIRVAGNIADESQIGSIQFAAHTFGSPLIVVLGHSGCGAVRATLEKIEKPMEKIPSDLNSIVESISPNLEALWQSQYPPDKEELMPQAVITNIRASVYYLKEEEEVLKPLVHQKKLFIIGAEYSLETGKVEFFENYMH